MNSEREEFVKMENLRQLKNENEHLENDIDEINSKCFYLKGEIETMKEKLEESSRELNYRTSQLLEIKSNLKSLDSIENKENVKIIDKKNVHQIQSSLTRRNLEYIFEKFLPEWDDCFEKQDKYFYQKDHLEEHPFSNLIFKNIFVVFQYGETSNITNELIIKSTKQSFLISKHTTFEDLKINACKFWSLSDPNIFIITDQIEGIILNEEDLIDQYLREYSINMNEFKLTRINRLKNKTILDNKNEQIINSKNQINQRKRTHNVSKQSNISELKFLNKTKSFFLEYPRFKEYTLNNGNEKEIDFNNTENQAYLKKENLLKISRETSFIKLILLLIMLIGSSLFLSESRSLMENYENSKSIHFLLENKEVNDLNSFFNYTVSTLGFQFFFEEFDKEKKYLENFKESFIEPFKILGYGRFIKNESDPILVQKFLNKENELIDIEKIFDNMESSMRRKELNFTTDLSLIVSKVDSKLCQKYKTINNLIDSDEKCFPVIHFPNKFPAEELISEENNENSFISNPKKVNGSPKESVNIYFVKIRF